MKDKLWTGLVVVLVVALCIVLILVIVKAASKGGYASQRIERDQSEGTEYLTEHGDRAYLYTVKHDGHLFIVPGYYKQSFCLHHPDCPCKEKDNVEVDRVVAEGMQLRERHQHK